MTETTNMFLDMIADKGRIGLKILGDKAYRKITGEWMLPIVLTVETVDADGVIDGEEYSLADFPANLFDDKDRLKEVFSSVSDKERDWERAFEELGVKLYTEEL